MKKKTKQNNNKNKNPVLIAAKIYKYLNKTITIKTKILL